MRGHGPTTSQLIALLEASKLLNSTLDLTTLLNRILQCARDLSGADRATLYLVDHETSELWTMTMAGDKIQSFRLPMGKGIAGRAAQTGRVGNIADAYRSPHFNRDLDAKTGYRTRSMLTVPFRGRDRRVLGVIQTINHLERGHFGPAERWSIERLGDYAALAIENAMFVKALQDKKRMEEDLLAARHIQGSLLPKSLPRVAGVDLAARYTPCLEVGGDCFDALALPGGRLGFSLGDISGKGITAALMMANLQALFRVEARRDGEPHAVLSTMNRLFHESTQVEHFATFFYGILDPVTGLLRFCSAGHESPVLLRGDGSILEVDRGGVPLGILPDFPFVTQEAALRQGDLCLIYSDGITEQNDPKRREFGRARLISIVRQSRHLPAEALAQAVEVAVREFARGQKQWDDLTLVVLRLAVGTPAVVADGAAPAVTSGERPGAPAESAGDH